MVFTVAISLCYLLASKGVAFDSRFPSKGIFILLFFCGFYFLLEFLFLQTDPYILSHLIYPLQYHVTLVLLYILRRFDHLILLYSHNTLLPKKGLFPYLYFKFACLSKIINANFPFKYPMNDDTLNFGGIITNICTWSLIKCPSIISTPLYRQSVLNISPISFLR